MPIPTRVRVREAHNKPVGDDPKLPAVWQTSPRPDRSLYIRALLNWRAQSTAENESASDKHREQHHDT